MSRQLKQAAQQAIRAMETGEGLREASLVLRGALMVDPPTYVQLPLATTQRMLDVALHVLAERWYEPAQDRLKAAIEAALLEMDR